MNRYFKPNSKSFENNNNMWSHRVKLHSIPTENGVVCDGRRNWFVDEKSHSMLANRMEENIR